MWRWVFVLILCASLAHAAVLRLHERKVSMNNPLVYRFAMWKSGLKQEDKEKEKTLTTDDPEITHDAYIKFQLEVVSDNLNGTHANPASLESDIAVLIIHSTVLYHNEPRPFSFNMEGCDFSVCDHDLYEGGDSFDHIISSEGSTDEEESGSKDDKEGPGSKDDEGAAKQPEGEGDDANEKAKDTADDGVEDAKDTADDDAKGKDSTAKRQARDDVGGDVQPVGPPAPPRKKLRCLEEFMCPSYDNMNVIYDSSKLYLSEEMFTSEAGYYFIVILNNNRKDVEVDGYIRYVNPFGYLPAEHYPLLKFYLYLCLVSVAAAVIWFVVCLWHWRTILVVQSWLSIPLVLFMSEALLHYFHLSSFNSNGSYIAGLVLGISVISALKYATSWMMILLISMGYSICKADLGENMGRVLLLTAVFFFTNCIQTIVDLIGKYEHYDVISFVQFFTLLQIILGAIWYWWIFLSLTRTIAQLSLRQQTSKLRIFNRFFMLLIFSALCCIGVLIGNLYFENYSNFHDNWKYEWFWLYAVWQLLFFSVLVMIAVLMRPTEENMSFIYTPLTETETGTPMKPVRDVEEARFTLLEDDEEEEVKQS